MKQSQYIISDALYRSQQVALLQQSIPGNCKYLNQIHEIIS